MLNEVIAEKVINAALNKGADFVELFCEDRDEVMIDEQHGSILNSANARMYGVGIRVLNGTKSGNTYTNDVSEESLVSLASEAAAALRCKSNGLLCAPLSLKEYRPANLIKRLPADVPLQEKADLLKEIDAFAFTVSPLLKNMRTEYFEIDQKVTVYNSDGTWATDKRIYCRVRLTITVGDGEKSVLKWRDLIRNDGFGFDDTGEWKSEITDLIEEMVRLLHVGSGPSGVMDVVFEKGESSLFHEACGHPFEGAANAEGLSVFAGKMGQKVASDKVTWVDNGTVPNTYGAIGMDDTGHASQRNVLIQNGILTGYMLEKLSARKLGVEPGGNGRRQNYTFAPTDRMTNTYIEAGEDDEQEMISSLEKGLFVKTIGGGNVNPITGSFNVEVSEGYLIENGKITRPVSGMTISGNGAEVLMNVDRVGKDSPIPTRRGSFCGSYSGLVPVTCYQPRVRVRGMIVGGKGDAE